MGPNQHPSQSMPKRPASNARSTSRKMDPQATKSDTSLKMVPNENSNSGTSDKRATMETQNYNVGHVRSLALCNEIIDKQRSMKRTNHHITPPTNNSKFKKRRSRSRSPPKYATPGTSRGQNATYASVTGITKVAILPAEFPRVILPQVSLGIIEKLL